MKSIIIKEVGLTTAAKIATAIFAVLISLLITRLSGKEAYGIISLSNQLLGFFIVVIIGGYYQHITRYIARSRLSIESLFKIKGSITSIVSKRTLKITPLALMIAWPLFVVQNESTQGLLVFSVLTIGLVFQVLSRINASILLGLRKVWQSSWAENTSVNFIVCVLLITIYTISGQITITTIALIYVGARLVTYVATNVYLDRSINSRLNTEYNAAGDDINHRELDANRSFAVISLTSYAYTLSSGMMLGLFGNLGNVGEYNIALKICSPLLFISSAIQRSYNPRIAKAYKANNISYLKKSYLDLALAATVIFILFSTPVILLKSDILALWQIDSPEMFNVLLILLTAHGLNIISANAGPILTMTQYEKQHAQLNIVGLIVNIISTIALVYYFGITGAAWSYLLNIVFVNAAKGWLMLKLLLNEK